MPIYTKGKGRWTVVIKFRGRRKDWIVRGSKEEAKAFEARERLKLEAADPDLDPRTVPTFSSFCVTHYRPHAEKYVKANTWEKRASLLAFLMEHFGRWKLTELHSRLIDDYIERRRAAGLRNVSINNELRVLRIVVNFARKERKLPVADVAVKLLPEESRRVRSWSLDEIDRFLVACQELEPEILPIAVCLLNTGMRKGEALALTWPQVDAERREIRIWPSDEWQPKNGKPREVPISNGLWPLLSGARTSEKWVFPSRTGDRWRFWPKRQFNAVRKKAGVTGGPHTLRHTFASHFLAKVPDLGLLAEILGHSEESVTRLYQHMLPERLARARNVVSIGMPGSSGPRAKGRAGGMPSVVREPLVTLG